MKLLIASDIHGSALWCERMLEVWEREKPQKLVLLGDLLYHGARNDLPDEYSPKRVTAMLNEIRQELLCVRGNCDSEVDQMVFSFPIMAEYGFLYERDRMFFLTHGHIYHEKNLPMLKQGDLLIHGHTHIPVVRETKDYCYLNPGSVAIPKEQSPHSCMVYEEGRVSWLDLAQGGRCWKEWSLPNRIDE